MNKVNTISNHEYPAYNSGKLSYSLDHETLRNFHVFQEQIKNMEKKAKSKCNSTEQRVVKIITTYTHEEPQCKQKNKLLNNKLSKNNKIVIDLFHAI